MAPRTALVTGESLTGLGSHTHPHHAHMQKTNGKAERFINTLVVEWAYVITYPRPAEGNRWLPHNLGISIRQRAKWLSVASRLSSASSHS